MGKIYTRVHRLLKLVQVIQSKRGLNAGELSRICGIHERSIYRDIDTLNASGIPCAFDEESGGYQIRRGFFMPPVELTFEEAMAVVALLEEVGRDGQVPFMEAAGRAVEKIRSQLPTSVMESLTPLEDRVAIDLPSTQSDESSRDVYQQVRKAIANRKALSCMYESIGGNGNDEEFEFHPYSLWFCQRAWYAVGFHGQRKEVRKLKLNRFTSVQNTDRVYTIPDKFDPRDDLGYAWRMIRGDKRYEVAVRFDPYFADNASETRWHCTQEEQWDDEGRVTLKFTVDGLDEIAWWVLGYGPGATVLEPEELIQKVSELAKDTAAKYAKELAPETNTDTQPVERSTS